MAEGELALAAEAKEVAVREAEAPTVEAAQVEAAMTVQAAEAARADLVSCAQPEDLKRVRRDQSRAPAFSSRAGIRRAASALLLR